MMCRHSERGFVLIPVVIAIVLIAAAVLSMNLSGVSQSQQINGERQRDELHYLTEAAISHAKSQLNRNTDCNNYTSTVSTPFAGGSYAVGVSAVSGSPVDLTVSGRLANGVTETRVVTGHRVYQPTVTLTLQPGTDGKDTYLRDGGNDDNNFGAATILKINNASAEEVSLLEFDVESIPSTSTIVSATLSLHLNGGDGVTNGIVDAHRVTQAWIEGVEDGDRPDNGAGATYTDYNGQAKWANDGGDYAPTPLSSANINSVATNWYEWDLTAATDQWITGIANNNGVLLRASAGDVDKIFFASADGTAALRPKLTIVYTCECGQICPADAPDVSDGMISHWPLDETTGTTAQDIVGSNDGTLVNGPVWTGGRIDGGLSMDGSNDHVDAGTFDVDGSGITMTGWFFADRVDNEGRMISKATSVNERDAWWQLGVDDSSGSYFLRMRIKASGRTRTFRDATQPLATGRWYMATATYDEISGLMSLYLDGQLLSTQTHAEGGTLDTNPSVPVWLGANGSVDRHFDGVLDDLRLFDRALSDSEVEQLYAQTSTADRVAYWTFDETSGIVAEDSVSTNDGTLINGPTWSADGKVDGSLIFDGNNDRVTVAHNSDVEFFSTRFTVMGWVRDTSDGSTSQRILSKETSGANDNFWMAFSFGAVFVGVDGNFYSPPVTVTTDTWYHVAVTFDDAADQLRVYVDGVLTLDTTTTASVGTNTEPLIIGGNWESGKTWDGDIDDLMILNRVLSPNEIFAASDDGIGRLYAHWPLDDSAGSTAQDIVGINDGTLQDNPVWTIGRLAGALDFDGSNDDVSLGTMDVPGGGLTMSAWFNTDSFSNDGRIISKADGTSESDAWWQMSYSDRGSSNYLRMRIKAGGSTTTLHDNNVALATDQWYLATATYDAISGEMRLYLDGVLIDSRSHSRGGAVDSGSGVPAAIGSNGTLTRYFDGTIDDVRLYNYALDATTVNGLFEAGRPCDGNYVDAFNNRSFDGNDGSLTWTSDWVEVGEFDGETSGDVQVMSDSSGTQADFMLRIRDNENGGEGVVRTFRLVGANSATLQLRYRRDRLDNANDYVGVYISESGSSGSFTELPPPYIEGGGTDNDYVSFSRDISGFSGDDIALMLRSSSQLGNNDAVFFDDIQISCSP